MKRQKYIKRWDIDRLLTIQKDIDEIYYLNSGTTGAETFKKRKLALWVEIGELVNEWKELFKFWSNKTMDRAKALEEYIDCLHFLLSIGNDLGASRIHETVIKFEDPIDQIFFLSAVVINITDFEAYNDAFSLFRGLGEHLGFNDEEVLEAYLRKNTINHNREDHVLKGGSRG